QLLKAAHHLLGRFAASRLDPDRHGAPAPQNAKTKTPGLGSGEGLVKPSDAGSQPGKRGPGMPVWSILGSVIRLCVRNSCGIRRGLLLGAGLAVVSGTAGCRSTPAYQGASHDVLATYHYRKLRSDLP